MVRPTTRRIVLSAAACIGVVLAIAVFPLASEMSGATAWSRQLAPAVRAEYLSTSGAALPRVYRHALFATITSPAERAAFWRRVFDSYRSQHSLTGNQQHTLQQVESLLTPDLFRFALVGERAKTVASAREAIRRSLGQEAESELFLTAGPEVTATDALPVLERVAYVLRGKRPTRIIAALAVLVPELRASSCNCLYQSDCSYSQTCGNPVDCDVTNWGCGDLWASGCGSICYYAP